MLRGIGTSKGIGIGKALIIHKCKNAVSRAKINDTEAEVDKFNEAVEKFIQETNELVDKLSQKLNGDDKNALVLKNQEYLIRDPEFTSGVISAITNDKLNAEAAVEDTCEMLKNIFLSFNNDTMTQRVADIEDMKQRLIAIMQGQKHIDLTKLSDNTVIIADEIHPSMTANMDTEHIAGIISEKGGDTSHASILARALEIPAVLSVKDICSKIAEGEEVIVDGAYGEVFVNPTPITLKIYNKKKKAYDENVKAVAADRKRVQEELESLPEKRQILAECTRSVEESQQLLDKLYELNVIFPKYRDLVAVSQMYEYVASGRCNTLSGYEGAYNLYEQELRMNIVISQLEDIYDQLEEISTNQYMLYSAICESNNLLLEVANYTEMTAYNTGVIMLNSNIYGRYF